MVSSWRNHLATNRTNSKKVFIVVTTEKKRKTKKRLEAKQTKQKKKSCVINRLISKKINSLAFRKVSLFPSEKVFRPSKKKHFRSKKKTFPSGKKSIGYFRPHLTVFFFGVEFKIRWIPNPKSSLSSRKPHSHFPICIHSSHQTSTRTSFVSPS